MQFYCFGSCTSPTQPTFLVLTQTPVANPSSQQPEKENNSPIASVENSPDASSENKNPVVSEEPKTPLKKALVLEKQVGFRPESGLKPSLSDLPVPEKQINPKPNDDKKQVDDILGNQANISKNGGNFEGLKIDKYLSVAQNLALTKTTRISALINEILKSQLTKFPNLSVKIAEASDKALGQLKLILQSSDNKIANNTIVTISGFKPVDIDGIGLSGTIKLNYENYFSDLQTKTDYFEFSSDQILKYFTF